MPRKYVRNTGEMVLSTHITVPCAFEFLENLHDKILNRLPET